MKTNLPTPSTPHGPGSLWSAEGVCSPAEAHRLFRRTLARWAGDLLELRRKGLERPCRRLVDAEECPSRAALRLDGLW